MMRSALPPTDPFRAAGDGLDEVLDALIESWPRHRISDHLHLEIAAAFDADRSACLPSVLVMIREGVANVREKTRRSYLDAFSQPNSLAPSDPVPGCGCAGCTGIPADHPVRQVAVQRSKASSRGRAEVVERARDVSILEVARRLGLGEPVKRGKSLLLRCPLHDDQDPSMSIDVEKGLWYCFPCGEGGDGISLYMKTRRQSFGDTVRELAS